MNLNNDVIPRLSESRNSVRQKKTRDKSVLSSGKWLRIVKSSPKVSCEVSSCPSHYQSEKMHQKVISLPSETESDYSQGTLRFTIRANGKPHFVFKLGNQRDMYVASLSSNVQDQASYMIHLQTPESSSHLVGRINVSTFFSERIIEREFVLYSNNGQIPPRRENRGLFQKVAHVINNNQSISGLGRTSFIPDLGSWQLQEPNNINFEQVKLLENNKLPTNLETLAVVVKEETVEEEEEEEEEEVGGWGLKFLKKSPMMVKLKTNDASKTKTSMNVVIPSGIHGGPEDCPSSLTERWKSPGSCDCGGWDLGCSLTILKGLPRKDEFELSIEGIKNDKPGLKIVKVRGGLFFIKFQTKLSVLQSFSIALAFIHSKKLGWLHL